MAIGKVNAYATVEGGIVDYGKMAYGAIDDVLKDDAIQRKLAQDKAEAAAKAKTDRQKDIKAFSGVDVSGNMTIDDALLPAAKMYGDAYYENTNKYIATGDYRYKANAEKIQKTVDIFKTVTPAFLTKMDEISKGVADKKFNPNYASDAINLGKSVSEGKIEVGLDENYNPVATIYKVGDDGKPTGEILKKVPVMGLVKELQIPKYYDVNEDVKSFKANNIMALSEFYNASKTMKTGVKELTPTLIENINTMAESVSKNDDAMAQLMIDAGLGKKISGYTDQDRAAVKKYYTDYLTNTFQKEVNKDYTQPRQDTDGDGTNKSTFSRNPYVPTETSFTYTDGGVTYNYGTGAKSQAIPISDPTNKKEQVILSSLPILYKNGKATAKATNVLVTDMVYDKKDRLVIRGTYVTKKSKTFKKADGNEIEMLVDSMMPPGLSPEDQNKWNEAKNELELQSSQEGEEREIVVEPVGNAVESQILAKLTGKQINGVTITNIATLKQAMGYNKNAGSSIPTASNSEWIKAGWTQSQINEAVKSGKIKVQ